MKFDEVFTHTGEYGRYHKLVTFSVCSLAISCAFSNIVTVFINGSMDHHCRRSEARNCSTADDGDCWRASQPPDDEGTFFINETRCRMYATDGNGTELINCEDGWVYDRSQYESTIVSEFDLVCEDSYLVSMSSSIYLAGFFAGSLVFGLVCDYFGRKISTFLALGLIIISGVISGLSKGYWLYVCTRFLSGAANIGLYLSLFAYVTELVGPSKRAMMATLTTMYWCLGYMLVPLIAYFIRSWNTLLLVSSLLLIPLFSLYCFVPESARWLLIKRRPDEAKRVLQRFAKGNKRDELPDEILKTLEVDDGVPTKDESKKRKSNALTIIRCRSMLKKTSNITYSWFSINLVYYGLTYGVEGLNVDVHIGTFLGGLTEVVAYLFAWFIIQRFGRRYTLGGTLVAGGMACFTNIWIKSGLVGLRTAIAMIGKFFITSAFGIVYVFTVELFPTDIRAIGLGICSFCSRVAGVLAPQILFLQKLWTPLPLVTFSVMSVTAGLLTFFLPETLNIPLPQTIEEAEMMTRKTDKRKNGGFEEIGMKPVET